MRRFVRESLRFAHRGAPGHPDSAHPDRDVVQPSVAYGWKSSPRKSDAISVDPTCSNYTHQKRFRHGVDTPISAHDHGVRRALQPRVAPMPYFTCQNWILAFGRDL